MQGAVVGLRRISHLITPFTRACNLPPQPFLQESESLPKQLIASQAIVDRTSFFMGASASSIPDDCVVLVTGASRGIGKVRPPPHILDRSLTLSSDMRRVSEAGGSNCIDAAHRVVLVDAMISQ